MLRIVTLIIFALSFAAGPLFTYQAFHPTDYHAFDRVNSVVTTGTLAILGWFGLITSGRALRRADQRVRAEKADYVDSEHQRAVLTGILAFSLVIGVYYGVMALLELRRTYYAFERSLYSIAALFGWFGVVAAASQLRKLGATLPNSFVEQDRRAKLHVIQTLCMAWALLFTLGATTCAHGPTHAGDPKRFHITDFFVLEAVFAAPGFIGFFFCTRALKKGGPIKRQARGFEVLPPKE